MENRRNQILLMTSFALISLLMYYPSWENGFVTDWMSWIYWYKAGDYGDIIHCFGYPGLHQFFHLIHYTMYRICGTNHFMWYVPYALMHGVNAYILLRLTTQAARLYGLRDIPFVAWATAIIFLISPYQCETVIWKVCFHYMMSLALVMGSFLLLIRYLSDSSPKNLIYHHILFILSLLTLEITLAAPFIFLAFSLIYLYRNEQLLEKKALLIKTFGVQCLLLVSYFLANRLFIGSWVGHYGAEQHLNFDWVMIGGNGLKYLSKYLFFGHYWPYNAKISLYTFYDENALNIGLSLLVLIALATWIIFKLKQLPAQIALAFFSLIAFFMGIFPIANLFFMRLHPYENDRYGYVASAFFYLFIVCMISLLPRILRYITAGLYIFFTGYLFITMMLTAREAGHIHRALVQKFDFYDRKEIVFLSKPENYNGMCIFRDLSGKAMAFRESLDLFIDRPYSGEMTDIAQINMASPTDGVRVSQIDSLTLAVALTAGGTWFWNSGFGLTDYQTNEYEVTLGEWHYKVHFYQDPSDKTFLYFVGDEWKEFTFE